MYVAKPKTKCERDLHFTILVDIKPAGGPAIFGHAGMKHYGTIPANKSTTVIEGFIQRVLGPPELKFSALACVFAKRAFPFLRKPRKLEATR
jgi:hypothetical protein